MANTRGPIPKPIDQTLSRGRRYYKGQEVDQIVSDIPLEIPEADENWHPIARFWYESHFKSAQAVYQQNTDIAWLFLLAEQMSRELKPQPVGVHPETGEVVVAKIPMKGASMSAYLKASSQLGDMEGDRRRLQMELKNAQEVQQQALEGGAEVTVLDARRDLLG